MKRISKNYDIRQNISQEQKQLLYTMGRRAKSYSAEGHAVKVSDYNIFDEEEQAFPLEWQNRNMLKSLPIRDGIDLLSILENNFEYYGRFIRIIHQHINNLGQIIKYDRHNKIYIPVSKKADVYSLVRMKETAGRKFIKVLEDKHLIKEYRGSYTDNKGNIRTQKYYYISPIIFRTAKIHPDTYMLFKDELDEYLQPYCSQLLMRAWNVMHSMDDCDESTEDEEDIADIIPPVSLHESDNIVAGDLEKFCDTLYGSNRPLFFKEYTTLVNPQPGLENLFFMVQPAVDGAKMHRNDAVKEFRYITLDVDIKKQGKAISDEEISILEEYKQEVHNILKALPSPTTAVKTRNGLQMVWRLSKAVSQEEWNQLQGALAMTVGDFADRNAVKAGGILRCPESYHKKEGTAPYPVQLIEADDTNIYEPDKLLGALIACDITAEIDKFFLDNPLLLEKSTTAAAPHEVVRNNISSGNNRIEAIKTLSPVKIAEATTIVNSLEEAKNIIKSQNIAEILDITTNCNGSFSCIFHEDKHPSAFIYFDKNGFCRYVCMSSNCELYSAHGKSDDIFGVVQRLANCSYKEALTYLVAAFNIRIENKKIA